MEQTIVNAAIALGGGVISFLLQRIFASISQLQCRDTKIAEKLSQIEVHLAGSYVRREEMMSSQQLIFSKLEKIESKLDAKADK